MFAVQKMENNIISAGKWNEWAGYIYDTFKISLPENAVSQFNHLLNELIIWNEKMNLVSFRSAEEILWRHFADSLAGLSMINKFSSSTKPLIIDIGTGAGFPGFPIKIAKPSCSLIMIESITKKCLFLTHIKKQLNFSDIKIINDRAEIICREPKLKANCDFVLSRAVSKFSPNLEIAIPFLKIGGTAIIYKTKNSIEGDEGLKTIDNALNILGAKLEDKIFYSIPGGDQEYCILAFKKIKDTPGQYPRRVGIPEKKPL